MTGASLKLRIRADPILVQAAAFHLKRPLDYHLPCFPIGCNSLGSPLASGGGSFAGKSQAPSSVQGP